MYAAHKLLARRFATNRATLSTPEMNLKKVLKRMGQTKLPPPATPAGLYVPTVIDRHLIYVSGHPPLDVDGNRILGVCKSDEDVAQAKIAASHCALAMLATLKSRLGSLNNVKRVIKSLGMVNCVQPFGRQPDVMNGYSEVMAEVFGNENGVGVRSAVGMVLPNEISVEVEAVFELVEYKKKFGDIDNFIKGNRDLWIQYLKDDEKNFAGYDPKLQSDEYKWKFYKDTVGEDFDQDEMH